MAAENYKQLNLRSHDSIHGIRTPADQWADWPAQSPDPAHSDDGNSAV